MLSINTNMLSSGLVIAGKTSQKRIDTSIERLSSGKRINSAKDDVAGAQIGSRLTAEIIGLAQATRNASDTQSLLDLADQAAKNTEENLLKLRGLAVNARNETLSASDLSSINQEADQILQSINQTASSVNFSGLKLLDGTFTNKSFQITNSVNGSLNLSLESLSYETLGLKNLDLTVRDSKSEIVGTSGADSLVGNEAINIVTGDIGHDVIDGKGGNDVSIFNEDYSNFDIFKGAFTTLNVMGNHSQNVEIGFEIIDTNGTIYRVSYSPSNTATQDVAQQLVNASIKDISGNTITNPGFTLSKGADASIYIRKTDGSDFSVRPWGGVNQGSISSVANSSSSGYYDVAINATGKRVVTWSTTAPSGGSGKILVQRYDASGNLEGDVITVKSSGNVQRPSLTFLDNDHIALTYFEYNQSTGYRDIHLNIIDDYGFVVHSSRVNEGDAIGDYINPEVTNLGNSEFLVQWTFSQNHPQTQPIGSYAQLYHYEGTKRGEKFIVSEVTSGSAAANRALKLDNSKFVMPTHKNSDDLSFQIYNKSVTTNVLQSNEFQLNTYTANDQQSPVSTPLANGEFVTVWTSSGQDGSGNGVFAQKFNGLGNKVGSEFRVNSHTTNDQGFATATTLSNGDFLVTWTSNSQSSNTSGYDLYGQRYDGSANKIGSEFLISKTIEGDQAYAGSINVPGQSVGALNNSGFVVTWHNQNSSTGDYDIHSQIFDSSNNKVLMPDNKGLSDSEIQVNTYSNNHQTTPTVAKLGNTGFVTVWSSRDQDGSDQGIFGQQFNNAGEKVGSEFQVNTHTNRNQSLPSVSKLENGGFVATWVSDQQEGSGLSDGLYGQIFDSTANKMGNEFLINTTTSGSQTAPAVVGLNNGGFVVSWHGNTSANGDYNINSQIFNASGTKVGSEISVNTVTLGNQKLPSVTSFDDNSFVITWQTIGEDGDLFSIVAQLHDVSGNKVGSPFQVNTTTTGSQINPDISKLSNGNMVITWGSDESPSHPGKNNSNDVSIVANHPNASHNYFIQFTDDTTGGMIAPYTAGGGIDTSLDPNSKIEILGKEYTISQGTTAQKTSDLKAQLAADGISSTIRTVGSPWGSYLEVDYGTLSDYVEAYETTSFNFYGDPLDVADGDSNDGDLQNNSSVSLVEWRERSDNIFGQIFQLNGNKVGSEFQVNTHTVGQQTETKVIGLSSGKFLVIWESHGGQDGDGSGIFGQFFESNGNKSGSEFRINTYSSGDQKLTEAVELSNGNIIISWDSYNQDGSGSGVYSQIINSSGIKLRSEERVNTVTSNHQTDPSITVFNDNSYAISWRTIGEDGDSFSIAAQLYDAAGKSVGSPFQVNTTTFGAQINPDMTKLANGNFVVSWFDYAADGDSVGMFAQIFQANGTKVGSEFQLNTYVSGQQTHGRVTALSTGGFISVWESHSDQDGDGSGIFGQFFNSDGSKSGTEFQINTFTSGDQKLANAIELSNGNIIVSWNSQTQDGSGKGVFAKILAPNQTTLKGVKDSFDTSNGSESSTMSTGLQAYISSSFPSSSTVDFDNNLTNKVRGISFDLSNKKDGILSATLRLKARPLDDQKAEGNDTILLSGFNDSGAAIMTKYNIGFGVDATPNNFFPFDWQHDDRPTVNPKGYELVIDLADFSSMEGGNKNMLSELNVHGILDIVISDDTIVDYAELEINGQIYDVKATKIAETPLSLSMVGQAVVSKSSQGFTITWIEGPNKDLYAQHFDANGNSLINKKLLLSNVNDATSLVTTDTSGNEYIDVLWGSTENNNSYFRRYSLSNLTEVAAHKTEIFSNKNYYLKGILDNNKKVIAFENADTASSVNFRSLDQVAMDKNTKFGHEGRIYDGYPELLETESINGTTNGDKDIVVVGKQHGEGSKSSTELYGIDRHKNIEWLKFSDGYYDVANDTFHANPFSPDLGDIPNPIPTIDSAIESVNSFRSKSGALYNQIEAIISNNINSLINKHKAEGNIADTNIAEESHQLAKNNLLLTSQSEMGRAMNVSKEILTNLLRSDNFLYKKSFIY